MSELNLTYDVLVEKFSLAMEKMDYDLMQQLIDKGLFSSEYFAKDSNNSFLYVFGLVA